MSKDMGKKCTNIKGWINFWQTYLNDWAEKPSFWRDFNVIKSSYIPSFSTTIYTFFAAFRSLSSYTHIYVAHCCGYLINWDRYFLACCRQTFTPFCSILYLDLSTVTHPQGAKKEANVARKLGHTECSHPATS